MSSAGSQPRSRARRALTLLAPTILVIAGSVPTTAATALPEVRGGRLSGPLPIAGGATLRPVARLPLGPGDWTVFAKGIVRNATTEVAVLRRAVCVLGVGRTTTPMQVAPLGGDGTSRTMPFLVTASRRLTRPAVAILRCKAPGSATGDLTIEDVRLEAMRTAALWTGTFSGPMVRHGARTSPTMVVERHATAPIDVPLLSADVAGVNVPAGSWAFTASGFIAGGSGPTEVDCLLTAGDHDRTSVVVNGDGTIADRRAFSLQMVHTFPTAGSAVLRCGRGGGNTATIGGLRIVAIRARTLDNHPFAGEYVYPGLTGAARPVVDAGYLDGPLEVTAGGGTETIAKMKLPNGRWLVTGTLLLEDAISASWPAVECRLGTDVSFDRTRIRLATSGTADRIQPAMIAWHGSLTGGAQVNLVCTVDTPLVQASWIKLTAYLVGTLSTVSIRVP